MTLKQLLILSHRVSLLICLAIGSMPAMADPFVHVGVDQDLPHLIARAKPGTVFLLAGGDHGTLSLRRVGGDEAAPLTLRAADPDNPPQLTSMTLTEVNHLVLDGIVFNHTFTPGDADRTLPFQITRSHHIAIRNSLFDGDIQRGGNPITEGLPRGFGLNVRGATNITIADNEIRTFFRGLVIGRSADVTVTGNHVHNIRMDGMNFAQVQRLLVENNLIREFARAVESGDHADMIQFWTASTNAPSEDIVIRGNVLNSGFMPHSQSIFMRNEVVDRGQAGEEMFYRNVVIEENVIINAHLHGITLGATDGLTIRRNTIIHNPYSAGAQPMRHLWRPTIRVTSAARNVVISENVTHGLPDVEGRADWEIKKNVISQYHAPALPGHYDRLFVSGSLGDPRDLESFFPNPDGPLASGQVGAALLQDSTAGQVARASLPKWDRRSGLIVQISSSETAGEVFFKTLPGDDLNLAELQTGKVEWDFGDGARTEGFAPTHLYAASGTYDVTAQLRLADGQILNRHLRIGVQTGEVVRFDSQSGVLSSFNGATVLQQQIQGVNGPIELGADHPNLVLPADMIRPIAGAPNVTLDLRLRMNRSLDSAGEILRIHPSLILSVSARGVLDLRFRPDEGQELRIQSSATPLIGGEWVNLRLSHDLSDGAISLFADDLLVARAEITQPFPTIGSHGLSLGHPSDPKRAMQGTIDRLSLRTAN